MCYNCGCGIPDDDMGQPDEAITEAMFEKAAKGFGMTLEETKQEVLKMLQKQIKEKTIHR